MSQHLHFDCFSGISGDMLLGALVDVGLPCADLEDLLNALKLDQVRISHKRVMRGPIEASKIEVVIRQGFRRALSVQDIHQLIKKSGLPAPVKDRSRSVFNLLAETEARVHGRTAATVHFHEVGVIDSLVDVVGAVAGVHALEVVRITASPVNLGAGFAQTSHGRLPVPPPAVAAMAQGIPVYSEGPPRELTTPTGMALLRTLADDFGSLPVLRPTQIGYGAGSANFDDWPNVLRIFLAPSASSPVGRADTVVELECNLDDLTPQAYETVIDRLLGAGALDVTLTPVIMKRGRPGIVLSALASREKIEGALAVLFEETTALGVRVQEVHRRVLERRFTSVQVRGAEVRMKVAELGQGRTKVSPEYVDCKRLAELTRRPVKDIMEEALVAYRRAHGGNRKGRTSR